MRLAPVRNFPDPDVLERDDAARLLVGGELEVVEAVVVEDEPAPLPGLVTAALLPKPALAIWKYRPTIESDGAR